jgi:hypothetical protein
MEINKTQGSDATTANLGKRRESLLKNNNIQKTELFHSTACTVMEIWLSGKTKRCACSEYKLHRNNDTHHANINTSK